MSQYSDQILGSAPDFGDFNLSYEQTEEMEKQFRKLKKQVKGMSKGKRKSKKKTKKLEKQMQVLELQCQKLQQQQLLQEATFNAFFKFLGLISGPINCLPPQTQPVIELPAPRDQR